MIHYVAVFTKRVTVSANFFSLLRSEQFVLRHLVDT